MLVLYLGLKEVVTTNTCSRMPLTGGITASQEVYELERSFIKLNSHFTSGPYFQAVSYCPISDDDEGVRPSKEDTPLVALSFVLIVTFLSFILGGKPCIESKILLGCSAALTIGMSYVIGTGMAVLCQNKLTVITPIVLFLAGGI